MFTSIIIAIAIGILFGIATGLTPGVHVNLVSLLLLTVSPFLLKFTSPIVLCCFIIAMAVTHTFLDTVPSIFLGASDSEKVVNILPGHRLLLEGKGFEAVKITITGSLLALILAVILTPLMIPVSVWVDPYLKRFMGLLLIAITLFMILKDKKRLLNLLIFLISGVLGLFVLNMPSLKDPLFPLLSGLFGISMLLMSISEKVSIPKQQFSDSISISKGETAKAVTAGTFAGMLTGFFPGVGPAQGAVLASQLTRKISDYGFMMLVGGIGTVNFIFSLVTFYTIEKARNGAVIVVQELLQSCTAGTIAVFMCVALIAGGIGTILTLRISKVFASLVSKVNYSILAGCVAVFVTILVFIFCGWLGILVLTVSTAIGIIPALTGTARNHQMGCLILPVILFFVL
jgi:putative membrane protein